jgi:hypothetical protein
MKQFGLKFNHGVEIGAYHAYIGHWRRTKDTKVLLIAMDEMAHKHKIEAMLESYGESPSRIIDFIFFNIGKTVGLFCKFSPIFMLDFVARTLEQFAFISYDYLAQKNLDFQVELCKMADKELEHEQYFRFKDR